MAQKIPKIELFLDSGAFGAWKRGIELPLKEYIAFIKKHERLVRGYVAMDVIPGLPAWRSEETGARAGGRASNTREVVEASAAKSYENLQRMKDAGLNPVPVFHQDEDYKWLEKMLKDGETYIGISPYLKSHRNKILEFLDTSFSIVCDAKGRPTVKTHGFGMTNPVLIARVPWYSVDSTSWAIGAGYGHIMVPVYEGGKANYRKPPIQVSVSGMRGEAKRQLEGWAQLQPLHYDAVMRFLDECELTITQVRNRSDARRHAIVKYFQGLEAVCQDITFQHRVDYKNTARHWDPDRKAPRRWSPAFKMIYAASPHAIALNTVLNERGVTQRLLSFFDLRDKRDDFLENYINTGLPGKLKKGPPKQRWTTDHYMSYRRLVMERRAKAQPEEGVVEGNFSLVTERG